MSQSSTGSKKAITSGQIVNAISIIFGICGISLWQIVEKYHLSLVSFVSGLIVGLIGIVLVSILAGFAINRYNAMKDAIWKYAKVVFIAITFLILIILMLLYISFCKQRFFPYVYDLIQSM